MKTRTYFFVPVIAALLLPVFAKGEVTIEEKKPVLIGRANPALTGVNELYLVMQPVDRQPAKDGLVWKQLRQKIEDRLKKAGLKIVPPVLPAKPIRARDIPELRVQMELLKLAEPPLYVFRVQLSFAVRACLQQHELYFKADVWKADPTIQAVTVRRMPKKVTSVTLEQLEAFIHAWHAANQKPAQSTDANSVTIAPEKKLKPITRPAKIKHGFVASKKSKIFHRPSCSSAKRIAPKNLTHYSTRDQAIRAGKRPCKRCKP